MLVGFVSENFYGGVGTFLIGTIVLLALSKNKQDTSRSRHDFSGSDVSLQNQLNIAETEAALEIKSEHQDNVPDSELIEAQRIRELAAKKSELAKKRGLDKLVVEIYDETKYFPSWIKKDGKHVPKFVKAAEEVELPELSAYSLQLGENTYIITRKSSTGYLHDGNYIDISVLAGDLTVFSISCSESIGEWVTTISPFAVDAYREGVWEEDFRKLHQGIEELNQKRRREAVVNKDELEKLKRNFDVDDKF